MIKQLISKNANSALEVKAPLKPIPQQPAGYHYSLLSIIFTLLSIFVFVAQSSAHETRPAYLQINEFTPGRYNVYWRTPVLSGMRLPVVLKFSNDVSYINDPIKIDLADSRIERWGIESEKGTLDGSRIDFVGLQATITDVLVRIERLDGQYSTTLVQSSQPWIEISSSNGPLTVAGAYLIHGIEHIIFGIDHLLFVLALVLIVKSYSVLLLTITSFTIAHSITLALATLGIVHVPGTPVEAVIALSILLVAVEIVRQKRGQYGMTARWPWIVAFTFGLLHGFGFASALTEIGLPRDDIPLALFTFNVGVEIGQLTFIAAVLGLIALVRRITITQVFERYALPAATYTIGALAAFWFIERLMGFWG